MIRKYEDKDFRLLELWISSADLLFQFAGTDFQYPITKEQIESYKNSQSNRQFYIFLDENNNEQGFGEIILQKSNNPRLARLIIGNLNERNKGLGEKFVKELVAESILIYNPIKIDLYVWIENHNAIKCYEKVGFEFNKNKSFSIEQNGKEFLIKKMSLYLN